MVGLMDLPFELLNVIVLSVAMSHNGAEELARASVTCEAFRTLANQPHVLRVVNLQNVRLRGQCEPHHHIDGLLSRCVRAGNLTAEWMLGQAVIKGGSPLWRQMFESNQVLSIKCATDLPLFKQSYIAKCLQTGSLADIPYILFWLEELPHIHEAYERLLPLKLVRSFLSLADAGTVHEMYVVVKEFIRFFVEMNFYEMNATPDALREIQADDSLREERLGVVLRLLKDGNPSFRDQVLSIFDDLFPQRGTCYLFCNV